jgi:ABC-type nitrate/sulfonate/bicarbonate transport system permease component
MRKFFDRMPLLSAMSLLAGVGIWWLLTDYFRFFPKQLFPGPLEVWRSVLRLSLDGDWWGGTLYGPNIFGHTGRTLMRILTGYSLALVVGIPLGVAIGRSRLAHRALTPYVEIFRPIPPIAFIPLTIVWFGFGLVQKAFLVFLGAFWPVLLSTIAGVRGVRNDVIRAGLMLGMGRTQLLYRVILPAALPNIMTGARVALGTASVAVFAAEFVGAEDGLGWLTLMAESLLRTSDIITGMIFIGLIGILLAGVYQLVERVVLRWHYIGN